MMVYSALFVGLLAASVLGLDRRLLFGRQVLFFVLVSMVFLLGLRYGVGSDFFSYNRIFNEIGDWSRFSLFVYHLSESTPVESGFALFMLLIKQLAGSYGVFVFILAIVSILLKFQIFKRLSPFIGISFLLYFSDEWFWKDLSGARVALASTFILFCVYYAYVRNLFLFMVFLFFAILCHSAAVIALPFYFVRFVSAPLLMAGVLVAAVGVAASGGVGLLVSEAASAFGFGDTSRLVKYANSKYAHGISAFGGTFMLHILLSSLMIYFYRPLVHKWAYNAVLIPMYVYGTVLMFVLNDYGIIAGRIREMLCVPALVVVLPSFILLFRGNQRLIPYLGIVAYCLLWFYMMTRDRAPYQSILQFF